MASLGAWLADQREERAIHGYLRQTSRMASAIVSSWPNPVAPASSAGDCQAIGAGTGGLFLKDALATGALERVDLQLGVLVVGRDAGVANQHAGSITQTSEVEMLQSTNEKARKIRRWHLRNGPKRADNTKEGLCYWPNSGGCRRDMRTPRTTWSE